jgi:hypothetical protein
MTLDRRTEPFNFAMANLSALPAGSRVLFLGKNHTKNALLVAKLGLHVEVLDADNTELVTLQEEASKEGLFLITRHTRIEYWQLPHAYDAIVLGELDLPSSKHTFLFEKILSSLAPKGILVGEVLGEGKTSMTLDPAIEPYGLIALYTLFESLPCRLIKLGKELTHVVHKKGVKEERYLLRMVIQKY